MDQKYWSLILGFMILNTSFILQQGLDSHAYCQTHLPQTNQTGTPESYRCIAQSIILPVLGLFVGVFLIVMQPTRKEK